MEKINIRKRNFSLIATEVCCRVDIFTNFSVVYINYAKSVNYIFHMSKTPRLWIYTLSGIITEKRIDIMFYIIAVHVVFCFFLSSWFCLHWTLIIVNFDWEVVLWHFCQNLRKKSNFSRIYSISSRKWHVNYYRRLSIMST